MTEKQQGIIDFFAYITDELTRTAEINNAFDILGTPGRYEAFAENITKDHILKVAYLMLSPDAVKKEELTTAEIDEYAQQLKIYNLLYCTTEGRKEYLKRIDAMSVLYLMIIVQSDTPVKERQTHSRTVYTQRPKAWQTPSKKKKFTPTPPPPAEYTQMLTDNIVFAVCEAQINEKRKKGKEIKEDENETKRTTTKLMQTEKDRYGITVLLTITEKVRKISTTAAALLVMSISTPFYDRDTGTATIPLEEYANRRNLASLTMAQSQLDIDTDTLMGIIVKANTYRGGKSHGFDKNLIVERAACSNGIITIEFTEKMRKLLKNDHYMHLPLLYFSLNRYKYRYAPAMLVKLSDHKNKNIGKKNENTIGVKSLIEACGLDATENKAAHFTRDTMDPFTANLDALNSVLTWKFIGKGGIQIEEPKNWKEFTEANIRVYWNEYPNRKELLKAADKRKAKATKATKNGEK